ncbi:MFS transporter [Halosimplex pelagicum]|uniref:MFS transporter n=1 Tax=Halosimplex pelagicum TaxID=869886 RepID=A0A7D5P7E2_9EURY|nr:MFS transporter [Halosimplex pelagicum]QLH81041.1 MFS transporter [Halosimplex pelagicum]
MAATLREALRDRLGFWPALQWLVAGAVLYYLLDPSPAQFVTTTVSMAVFGLSELVTDVYDVRQSVRNAGFGLYALVGGSAMLVLGSESTWLPVGFVLVGAWFVVDAVQTVRHEGATEDEPTGREVYHDYVGRRVHEALEDGPRTRRELSEALDADDEAIDAALAKLRSRGAVVREGSAFRIDDADDGGVTARIAGLARRIARPLTLELGGDDAADADGADGADPKPGRAERAGTADGRDDRSDAGERERERERESAD